ncbi:hypothetical protein [Natrinema amylolyticum]|uniref:hypothetical protein n=1 Tax=Natrinema amylolyticum TaxID=2878679 RepID=UPI001CFBEE86|nr:hypothetical protein [Natrinema amylolyticum]
MNRRALLVGSGAAVSTTVAGCASDQTKDETGSGNGNSSEDDGGFEHTGIEPGPPKIDDVGLVSEWEEYGDLTSNAIETGTLDANQVVVAFRYNVYSHDGEVQYTTQAKLYGPDGSRVDRSSREIEELTGEDGWMKPEVAARFQPEDDWSAGEYEAEIIMRDEILDEVGDPGTGTFELE